MLSLWIYALASVSTVSLISLAGVLIIPVKKETLDKVLFFLVSLATGTMMGNAVVHLLPEAFEHATSPLAASTLILTGLLLCFLLEKVLNLRCHHSGGCHGTPECAEECSADCSERAEAAEHGHEHEHGHGHIHHTGWMALVSHGMDNFTDGIIIGTSYLVSIPVGLATTLAVVLHEIPMEFGGFGVLVNAGFSRWRAVLVNFLSALVALAGTALTLWLGTTIQWLPALLTPIAAGIVIYITAAGLIPKLQQEKCPRRSAVQFAIMVLGILAMIAVKFLE